MRANLKICIVTIISLVILVAVSVPVISRHVTKVGERYLYSAETVRKGDAIIILGAQVYNDGTPCLMLQDRLDTGLALYKRGIAPKIIVSGDHGTTAYDEVNVMRKYLLEKGVPSEDIFMDHAGFNTYDTMYRAEYVFGVRHPVVVSQAYHVIRAAYIGESMGIDTVAVSADANFDFSKRYGIAMKDWSAEREYASRYKAFWYSFFKIRPRILGKPILITGSGEQTIG